MKTLLLACSLLLPPAVFAAGAAAPGQDGQLLHDILDTFLAANDIKAALQTAKKGEALYPADPFWIKERAELSMWSSDPRGALEAFSKLLSFENTPELRKRVVALAIGMKDYDAALRALQLDLEANDLERVDDLIYIYEQLGKPEKAAALIDRYSARFNSPAGYSKAIELFTGMGDSDAAAARYRTSIARFGVSTAAALGYAQLLSSRHELTEALAVLRNAEKKAGPADADFWDMYGDLAWYLGDIGIAVKAAEVQDAAGAALAPEYDRLAAYYTAEGRHGEAERTYGRAWRATGKAYFLLSLINSMAARGDNKAVRETIGALSPEQERLAGASPYYWTIKAAAAASAGDQEGAMAAYRAALAADPDSEALKAQLLWALSAAHKAGELREELGRLSSGGAGVPEKQLALAYAYMAVDDPAAAEERLAAYRRLRGGGDAAAAAADAADAAGDKDTALELRFGRWLRLARTRAAGTFDSGADAVDWLNLCAVFCAAPRFAAETALLAPALPRDAVLNARLSRATAQGETDAARRYSLMMAERPVWLRLSEAMSAADTEELRSLLEDDYYGIPARDRINALQTLGRLDAARAETARLLPANGGDLALNLKKAELLLPASPRAAVSAFYRKRKALETGAAAASASAPAGERASISAGGTAYRRTAAGGGPLVLGKKEDSEAWAAFAWNGPRWDYSLKAGGRNAVERTFFAGAEISRALPRGTKVELASGYGVRADESVNLEAAGLKDFLSAAVSGRLAGPYYFRLAADDSQFFSQDRYYAGRLASLRGELSRLDKLPGWTLSSRLDYQNASASAGRGRKGDLAASSPWAGTSFVPAPFNQYGAGLTLTRDGYKLPLRRLSPYLSADYYYNSSFLGGFAARAGASCAPRDGALFELWGEYSKGYKGSGDEVRSAGASLTVYF